MNDMMGKQLKDTMIALSDAMCDNCKEAGLIKELVLNILTECRDMIDDAIDKHEADDAQRDAEESYDPDVLRLNLNTLDGSKPPVIWKPGWVAWWALLDESAETKPHLIKLSAADMNNSRCLNCCSIPTAGQLAGEIGGVKVIAWKDICGDIYIDTAIHHYHSLYNGIYSEEITRAICEKFNIPILSWEQIKEQYGGKVPELEE